MNLHNDLIVIVSVSDSVEKISMGKESWGARFGTYTSKSKECHEGNN